MKTRNHGLSEKEMELVQYLMADSKSTGDIQEKMKQLFAGTIEQMLEAEMDKHLYSIGINTAIRFQCSDYVKAFCSKSIQQSSADIPAVT
ncbi:MAG: hypothetical protein K2I00_00835 [Ruminococcus sp.]|nr:hypothetical protein [Ruminococcus sp.]